MWFNVIFFVEYSHKMLTWIFALLRSQIRYGSIISVMLVCTIILRRCSIRLSLLFCFHGNMFLGFTASLNAQFIFLHRWNGMKIVDLCVLAIISMRILNMTYLVQKQSLRFGVVPWRHPPGRNKMCRIYLDSHFEYPPNQLSMLEPVDVDLVLVGHQILTMTIEIFPNQMIRFALMD